MKHSDIRGLYYITYIGNLPSILEKGILSHAKIAAERISYTRIYDSSVIERRRRRSTPEGKSLWHYVNLFFQPRNSMLFRLIRDKEIGRQNLAVLGVEQKVLQNQGVFITDGNAASSKTQFYSQPEGLEILQTQQEIIQSDSWISWNHCEECRKLEYKLMAECLVPYQVEPGDIQRFIVADRDVATSLRARLSPSDFRKLVVATDRQSNIFTLSFKQGLKLCEIYDVSTTDM